MTHQSTQDHDYLDLLIMILVMERQVYVYGRQSSGEICSDLPPKIIRAEQMT